MHERLIHAMELLEARMTRARALRTRARLERQLKPKIAQAFLKQGAAVRAVLADYADEFPVREAFRISTWSAVWTLVAADTEGLFTAPLESAVGDALVTGALHQIGAFGLELAFSVDSPRAQAFLDGYAADQVRGINDTTRDVLRRIIAEGLRDQLSYTDIADQIAGRFKEFAGAVKSPRHIRSRAELVAVTEIGNAYAEGNRQGVLELRDAGLAMQKRWLTRDDDRVSDGCRANARAGWIDMDEAYPSGDQRPLRFPGCRCDEQYRIKPKRST